MLTEITPADHEFQIIAVQENIKERTSATGCILRV